MSSNVAGYEQIGYGVGEDSINSESATSECSLPKIIDYDRLVA
jgi:hypothetical protein